MMSPYMDHLVEELITLCHPEKIYVFSYKMNLQGEIISFKLCVVAETPNKHTLEQQIYLTLDCEIPYDVVVYTDEEWEIYSQNTLSFARSISEKGQVVYDKTEK